MTVKKTIGKLHLWIGLGSGLIVFIVAITGCLFCFHDEIKDITRPWRFVEKVEKPYVMPSSLQKKAEALIGSGKAGYVMYIGKDRPAVTYVTNTLSTYAVYFNPYTGVHTGTDNLKTDFFIIVEYLHLYLLLPAPIGKQIVGISTILFVLMLISGIILWWPKRKTDRKRSFRIKWNGRWRRVNYDLHNVLGFYAASIALILAVTGLAIDYKWMHKAMYKAANLGRDYPEELRKPNIDTLLKTPKGAVLPAIDKAFLITQRLSPASEMYFISPAAGKSEPLSSGAYAKTLNYNQQSNYLFHPATGQLLKSLPNGEKSAGMKLNEMNYGIHTGQILGLTGKIIAFFASLICASLPVTGFVIWWGRRNKKGKRKSVVKRTAAHLKHPPYRKLFTAADN